MKNSGINVDTLLKTVLYSTKTPDPALVERVKARQMKEEATLNKATARRSFVAIVAAVVVLAMTACAAWQFLKPSDVASQLDDAALSAAFASKDSVKMKESITSGDYTYTLLGLVSGKDITNYPYYRNEKIRSDRTYVLLAIQRVDGSPILSTVEEEGGVPFYASVYIKGEKPWSVNMHTMNGGYSETILDGIVYRIVECDDITMFADCGLYFGVNPGSYYERHAFDYNEQTGELKADSSLHISSAVFNLPIDTSLADPERAQEYLDKIENAIIKLDTFKNMNDVILGFVDEEGNEVKFEHGPNSYFPIQSVKIIDEFTQEVEYIIVPNDIRVRTK